MSEQLLMFGLGQEFRVGDKVSWREGNFGTVVECVYGGWKAVCPFCEHGLIPVRDLPVPGVRESVVLHYRPSMLNKVEEDD